MHANQDAQKLPAPATAGPTPGGPTTGADSTNQPNDPGKPRQDSKRQVLRSSVVDRRIGLDRRDVPRLAAALGAGVTPKTGPTLTPGDGGEPDGEEGELDHVSELERRRGPGRRRTDWTRSAEEGELTDEQFLFLMAIEAFKRTNGKMFPTWTDVLEVVRLLGYRKTMASEVSLNNASDWREQPDAPSNTKRITSTRRAAA